jgi:hypothetical protein
MRHSRIVAKQSGQVRNSMRCAAWVYRLGEDVADTARSLRGLGLRDLSPEQGVDAPQFGKRFRGFGYLTLEMCDLFHTFFGGELQPMLGGTPGLSLDHFADLGEGEAELLAFEDHKQPLTVGAGEDPPPAVALGRKQATALIEPQGAMGQREFTGELVDAELGLIRIYVVFDRGIDQKGIGRAKSIGRVARMHRRASLEFKEYGKCRIAPAFEARIY